MSKKQKEVIETPEAENKPPELPQTKRKPTRKLVYLSICGGAGILGLILVVTYMVTMNMGAGAPGVLLLAGGAFGFWYFWKMQDELVVTGFHGEPVKKEQCNAMLIFRDRIVFTNMNEPLGIPKLCKNDKRKYYVMIDKSDNKVSKFEPFVLPDQRYYDPTVFAERVIELPAHRKLFTHEVGMGQYIKTGLLLVAMLIIGIVMIATSGGG